MKKIAMKWFVLVALLVSVGFSTGCALAEIQTPAEMVELQDSRRHYSAMTHDGVILRAQVIAQGADRSVPQGEHEFWAKSIKERMRTSGGYALLREEEIEAASGHEGTKLVFGRDQEGARFHYWVVLFVTEKNIHVLDAGGRAERFEAVESSIQEAIESYVVRR